jgi:ribonuclease HI
MTTDIVFALSSWNKFMLLWVPGHCEIQGNEDANALAGQESSSSFLGPEPEISNSPCVGRLKVKE